MAVKEIPSADAAHAHDDDDGQVQLVASETARIRARQHGGDLLCVPRQYDVFVGTGWQTAHSARTSLARVTARINAATLCSTTVPVAIPTVREYTGSMDSKLSDLKIQALLNSMIERHTVPAPGANALYVLFLDQSSRLSIGEFQSGVEFLAYHNHFHADKGEVRYIVVPFDSDLKREKRTTALAILDALNYPDGPPW